MAVVAVVTLFIIRIMDARTRRNVHNYTVVARPTVMVIGRTPPPALLCACVRSSANGVVRMESFSKEIPRTFPDFRPKRHALAEYPSRHLGTYFKKTFFVENFHKLPIKITINRSVDWRFTYCDRVIIRRFVPSANVLIANKSYLCDQYLCLGLARMHCFNF